MTLAASTSRLTTHRAGGLSASVPVLALLAGCGSGAGGGSNDTVGTTSSATTSTPSGSASSTSAVDGSRTSATALLANAKKSLVAARQVRAQGFGSSGGQKLAVDLAFSGDNSAGTITVGGQALKLLHVDTYTYFKASDGFWQQEAGAKAGALIRVIKGRWVKVGAGDKNFGDLTAFAARSSFATGFLVPDGSVSRGADKTVSGVACIALKDSTGGTLYVAADDQRPIQLAGTASEPGTINFTYGAVTVPGAPPASQVLPASFLRL